MLNDWRQLIVAASRGEIGLPVPGSSSELVPLGPVACAVRRDGRIFVGSIRESGWGGGQNIGELLMLEPLNNIPPGIREVSFAGTAIRISFTARVEERGAKTVSSYDIQSYRRVWAGAYATPDSDRRKERITDVRIIDGGSAVLLKLPEVRPGFVYEVRVSPRVLGLDDMWPGEAYVTAPGTPR